MIKNRAKRTTSTIEAAPITADEMNWTSEPPTKPGLYWYALIDSDGMRRHCEVFIPDFGEHTGKLCIMGGEGNHLASIPHRVWSGPLDPPSGHATWHGDPERNEQ